MFYLWCFWNCDTFEAYQKYVKKYVSIIEENKKLIERRKYEKIYNTNRLFVYR